MLMIWILVVVLVIAVTVLFWILIKDQKQRAIQQHHLADLADIESKVDGLSHNLHKTLEIMQDLAKKMHVQQELLDQSTAKIKQLELQNVELVKVMTQSIQSKK